MTDNNSHIYQNDRSSSSFPPSDWVETTLGEVCEIKSGSTPSTKEESFWNGEISWITPKDLSNYSSVYISKGEKSITQAGLKNSSAQLLPKNTILFSSRAPIGYVAIAQNELTTNQGFKNLVCDEKKSHFKFFYYLLKEKAGHIEKLSSGSTFSEASASLMRSIQISLPPLPEQQAIASVLSSFDDKIELLREQNKTLEEMGQVIFGEWFGKYSVDDELPEGWRVGKLGEVVNIVGGGTPSTENPDFWNGDIHWTSPKDLSSIRSLFLFDTEKKITREGLKKVSSGLLPKETLLLSSRAPIGYLAISTIKIAINQGYIAFSPDGYLSNYFMYLWLKGNMNLIIASANGSTFLEISKKSFKEIEIIIPDQETLKQFDEVIQPVFGKIRDNSEQIQSLARSRDELLPRLMRGEVRVRF